MLWFHRLQQRLSLTRNEAVTLIVLSLLFSGGLVARHIQERTNPIPPDAYEASDRQFFERSAQLGRDSTEHAAASDSVLANRGQPSTAAASGLRAAPDDPTEKPIDLNTATMAELETLPRIGPKTAERIVAFREAYGAFRVVDDLTQVRGIGPKTMELLRPLVRADPDSAAK